MKQIKYIDFWDETAQEVLKYISQEQVFYYVLNDYPNLSKRYYSPFREDSGAGCFFYYDSSGKLLFTDKSRHRTFNCFEIICYKYDLHNLSEVIQILKQLKPDDDINKSFVKPVKVKATIKTQSVEVTEEDLKFWGQYGITVNQLKSDNIRRVLQCLSIKGTKRKIYFFEDTYSYLIYNKKGKKKIYSPESYFKFIGNVGKDDIYEGFNKQVRQLLITKSYKDYRVIKNQDVNTTWFQSEVTFPSDQKLSEICKYNDEIIVFYDNDETGINRSIDLVKAINTFYPGKARGIHLPSKFLKENIKDSSDLYKHKGENHLTSFLNYHSIESYRNLS